jgi:tetratricopeptide (TPR) repeat protein
MHRAALGLLLALVVTTPLLAQRRGGTTRAPRRGASIPGLGAAAPTIRAERLRTEPARKGPIPFPSERRIWVRLETPRYTIFSSASIRTTRRIGEDLERLTASLLAAHPHFRLSTARTRVFLFGDTRDVEPYLDAARGFRIDSAGVTVRHAEGSTILIDCTQKGADSFTPRHELVHDLLRNRARPLPMWIEEGMAEYYSNAGQLIPEHVSRVRGRLPIPIEELFALRQDAPRALSWDFYAESWAVVAALLRRDRVAFNALLRDLDEGASMRDALRSRYRITLTDLEGLMRKTGMPVAQILPPGALADATPAPMERTELLFELGELLVRLDRAEDAERHFRAARPYLASAPGERPDVAFARFALHVRDGERDAAEALFPVLVETPRAHATRKLLLDVDIERADALARSGKLLEAAKILRELAPKMPDKARQNLEAQAAGLEAAARP